MNNKDGKDKNNFAPATVRKSNHKIMEKMQKEKPQKRHLKCYLGKEKR